MANTTRTQIPREVSAYYDRLLLERLLPELVFTRFAQIRDIPSHSGTNTIKFRRYESLSAATTPLSEGNPPSGSQLSVTDITATVEQYGDYISVTDVVQYESPDPVLTEAMEVLAEQAALTFDTLARDILVAGTNVYYAGSATDRASLTASDTLTADLVKKAVRLLQNNNAKKVTRVVNPDNGYNTSPINAAYIGIIHPNTLYDLKNESGWIPVEKYANKADVMPGEVGALDDVRFIMTSNAKVWTGAAGGGSVDVYATLIFGRNAFGITRISTQALKKYIVSGATKSDPLDQTTKVGWKGTFACKILNENAIVRIEHAVSA